MSTINTILDPAPDGTLHIPVPEAWRHLSIRVRAELEPVAAGAIPPLSDKAGFGALRGQISLSPEFDAPLEDFKDYME